jgi:hypothetical protein
VGTFLARTADSPLSIAQENPTNINFQGRASACSLLMGQTVQLFCIIVVLFIIIALPANAVEVATCSHDFNYTKGSTFESNLNTVFNSLIQHTSQTGFNTCTYGQIYGLLQCSGDTTVDQCHNCSQQATTRIRQDCGNAGGGLISLDACFLRYENYSFFGQLDTGGLYLYNPNNVSSPDVFNTALESLFVNLSAEAVSRSKLYASGTTTDSLSRKIYGLVQCWRDISSGNCTTCLSETINYIFSTFAGKAGARGLMGSCTVRYETYPFFSSTLPPSPAEAPAITPVADTPLKQITESPAITPVADTPSNNSTQVNQSDEKSSKKIIIILGIVGGLLLV